MYECTDEMVSHPKHYQGKNGLEVIDVIEAFTEELQGVEATDTGNIIKYACRWYAKGNEIQDLRKIIWYAQHLIDHLEQKEIELFRAQDRTALYCTGYDAAEPVKECCGKCNKKPVLTETQKSALYSKFIKERN